MNRIARLVGLPKSTLSRHRGGWIVPMVITATMIVTAGLLEKVESENELAFIIGHELGHFRNRDHIRGLGRGLAIGILITAVSGNDGGGAQLGATIAPVTEPFRPEGGAYGHGRTFGHSHGPADHAHSHD